MKTCECGCGSSVTRRYLPGHNARMRPVAEIFAARVEKTDGCWEWKGTSFTNGYSRMTIAPRKYGYAHRVSYELHVGPIPEGLVIDHLCRNRGCVNPDHLEAVTQQVNTLRGISPAAKYAAATECSQGHPWDEENTARDRRGRRICRACRGAWSRYYREQDAS